MALALSVAAHTRSVGIIDSASAEYFLFVDRSGSMVPLQIRASKYPLFVEQTTWAGMIYPFTADAIIPRPFSMTWLQMDSS